MRGGCFATCAWSSWMRSTRSRATIEAGTCSRCSSGSPAWRARDFSGSGSPRPSGTRRRWSTGWPGPAQGRRGVVLPPEDEGDRRGRHAGLRGLATERGRRHLPAPPGREATGVRRQPVAGRTARRGATAAARSRRSSRTARSARSSGTRRSRHSPSGTTASSWRPASWNWGSTWGTWTASSRSTPRPPCRASCSAWGAPGAGGDTDGTACSWRRRTRRSSRRRGLSTLWATGYVEPVRPPAMPYHILAQQLMALVLQEQGIGRSGLVAMGGRCPGIRHDAARVRREEIVEWMLRQEILWSEQGILGLGRQGEATYGRRNFLELFSVFLSPPLFSVLHGRQRAGLRR